LTLSDIKPIKPEDTMSNFKGIWQFKRGLWGWSGFCVFWLAAALISAVVILGLDRPDLATYGLRAAGSFLGITLVGLAIYALSSRGLVRLFCPAQRALKKTVWLKVRKRILSFNRDLAAAQGHDLFLRSYDRVPYAQVVSRFVELRANLVEEVEAVTKVFTQSCEAWCAAQNWNKALRILGQTAVCIDVANKQAEIGSTHAEMAGYNRGNGTED
jgi:hypothetical protein